MPGCTAWEAECGPQPACLPSGTLVGQWSAQMSVRLTPVQVLRTVPGTRSMRDVSLLLLLLVVVIIIIITDSIAFRVDHAGRHSNLEQRIQVNLVFAIMFAKASDSFISDFLLHFH